MSRSLKHMIAGMCFALSVLSISFISSSANQYGQVQAANFEWGTVNSSTPLNIRKKPNAYSKILTSVKKGKRVKCLTLKSDWVKVRVGKYTGYARGKYLTTAYGNATSPYKNVRKGTVNCDALVIRTSASTAGGKLTSLTKGTSLQVLTLPKEWIKVKFKTSSGSSLIGYCMGQYINCGNGKRADGSPIPKEPVEEPSYNATKGEQIIAYAKLFIGNRYVYGGSSLTNGTDCSGFTMRIYEHFGYSIPRTSLLQRSFGKEVPNISLAKPGDIICYDGHVALYMGNNTIIHASNSMPYPQGGIKISYNAQYRQILSIRRIID